MPEATVKNKKVLIVDDDRFLLSMYAMKFQKCGFNVDTARSGEEILNKLHDGATPDVLLIDVVMPVMDGLELLERIRKEKYVPNASVIVLSNQNRSADGERAQKLGIAGYIVKANAIPSEVVNEVIRVIAAPSA